MNDVSVCSLYVDEDHPFTLEKMTDRHSYRLLVSEQRDGVTFELILVYRDGNSSRCLDFSIPLRISNGGRKKSLTRPQT